MLQALSAQLNLLKLNNIERRTKPIFYRPSISVITFPQTDPEKALENKTPKLFFYRWYYSIRSYTILSSLWMSKRRDLTTIKLWRWIRRTTTDSWRMKQTSPASGTVKKTSQKKVQIPWKIPRQVWRRSLRVSSLPSAESLCFSVDVKSVVRDRGSGKDTTRWIEARLFTTDSRV